MPSSVNASVCIVRVKEILMRSCTDLGRDRYHQGAGVPNLVRMLMGT